MLKVLLEQAKKAMEQIIYIAISLFLLKIL